MYLLQGAIVDPCHGCTSLNLKLPRSGLWLVIMVTSQDYMLYKVSRSPSLIHSIDNKFGSEKNQHLTNIDGTC